MLWLLIILAVIFAFANGLRDSSSILAGVISSKALPPRLALNLVGIAELVAPFLFGVAVAKSSSELLSAFNRFFQDLRTSGTYDALVKKYYPSIYLYLGGFFKSEKGEQ